MILKDIAREQDIEQKLVRLYDEIDKHDKILILAPVYPAPSSSFSIKNIHKLIEVKENEYFSEKPENLSKFFNKIGKNHMPNGEKQTLLSSNTQFENIVFGMMVIPGKRQMSLYYNGFEKNEPGKMIPIQIKLTEVEADLIEKKIENLVRNSSFKDVDCSTKHPVNAAHCYTHIYKMATNNVDDSRLYDLLNFVQFDLSINRLSELLSVSICEEPKNDLVYKITGYKIDITNMPWKKICGLVNFSLEKKEKRPQKRQETRSANKKYDYNAIRTQLDRFIGNLDMTNVNDEKIQGFKEFAKTLKTDFSDDEFQLFLKNAHDLMGFKYEL